jgi:hypothetical protein
VFLVCNILVSFFYQVMEVREAIEEAQSTKALQELRKAVSMEQSAYPSVYINFGVALPALPRVLPRPCQLLQDLSLNGLV